VDSGRQPTIYQFVGAGPGWPTPSSGSFSIELERFLPHRG
jgi:hypothetical protein